MLRRRRRRKRDTAADAADCGCCLADVFVAWVVTGAAVVAWRRRR